MINVVNPDFLVIWFQPSRHWFSKAGPTPTLRPIATCSRCCYPIRWQKQPHIAF
jgi:hypothetical protein